MSSLITTKKLRPIWQRKHLRKKKLAGRPYSVGSLENQLLSLLIYYRTYTTQLFIGIYFVVDVATICRSIKGLEPLLVQIIEIKKEPVLKEKEVHFKIFEILPHIYRNSRDSYAIKMAIIAETVDFKNVR